MPKMERTKKGLFTPNFSSPLAENKNKKKFLHLNCLIKKKKKQNAIDLALESSLDLFPALQAKPFLLRKIQITGWLS